MTLRGLHSRATGLVFAVALAIPALAHAQGDAAQVDIDPAQEVCFPACDSGYLCHDGQCVLGCNPGCAANEVCNVVGACVSKCNPVCAESELCTAAGACVSKCNPPCSAGQQCTPAGECIGGAPDAAPVDFGELADPGWADRAFVLSLLSAVAIGGLAVGIVVANDPDTGLALGIPATILGGVAVPVIAAGGASARRTGDVEGSPVLRRVGWTLYGLALGSAAVMIGFGIGEMPTPAPLSGTVGLLGSASAVTLGIDARMSAREARAIGGFYPGVGAAHDLTGKATWTFGMRVTW